MRVSGLIWRRLFMGLVRNFFDNELFFTTRWGGGAVNRKERRFLPWWEKRIWSQHSPEATLEQTAWFPARHMTVLGESQHSPPCRKRPISQSARGGQGPLYLPPQGREAYPFPLCTPLYIPAWLPQLWPNYNLLRSTPCRPRDPHFSAEPTSPSCVFFREAVAGVWIATGLRAQAASGITSEIRERVPGKRRGKRRRRRRRRRGEKGVLNLETNISFGRALQRDAQRICSGVSEVFFPAFTGCFPCAWPAFRDLTSSWLCSILCFGWHSEREEGKTSRYALWML